MLLLMRHKIRQYVFKLENKWHNPIHVCPIHNISINVVKLMPKCVHQIMQNALDIVFSSSSSSSCFIFVIRSEIRQMTKPRWAFRTSNNVQKNLTFVRNCRERKKNTKKKPAQRSFTQWTLDIVWLANCSLFFHSSSRKYLYPNNEHLFGRAVYTFYGRISKITIFIHCFKDSQNSFLHSNISKNVQRQKRQ